MHISPPQMAHRTSSRIDYMLGWKTNPNSFKRINVIASIFLFHPDQNGVQLEIKRKMEKSDIYMENKQQNTNK